MSAMLDVLSCGPGVTVQDLGRSGYLAQGLSRGGAMDRLALHEGAALLGQPVGAALEMAGFGGRFRANAPLRIALTGAPMRASVDGTALVWHASHSVPAGAVLEIGGATAGVYGYLSIGGGLAEPEILGSQSAHLTAGLGRALAAGDSLALGADTGKETGLVLDVAPRWEGGALRILPSLQTAVFPKGERARFCAERFARDQRGNRMGVRLVPEGAGFGLAAGQTILSEVIVPGDIQIPGDGFPYILMAECQTTGGYPRIGTVIPADLPRVAQTAPGVAVSFRFVTREEALAAEASYRNDIKALRKRMRPLVRDPHDIRDLLSYTLISGVTAGRELS
ncbi:biotin-dependent carboxyltransferase family protein [Cognatishimia sp. F0-27]|uniref:5-oxoprolinase subunit C family protein n=1 Tax=Cognatishimia sp. F0-27 TaxID=2816855 RepID=UPI001D0C1B49|nr:biotin-dependent carboxyltransferase family protein [Cognatishimia sp. F0-27]MCC1493648.1 biotin-dependent carboxyltransferase family protein [Cognatishimia sp. F0-27]